MNIKSRLMALGLTGALLTGGVFIATHEGQVNGTYIDPAGIITACFGLVMFYSGSSKPTVKLITQSNRMVSSCMYLISLNISFMCRYS
jgi:GH24 family phage-related lysozyme (muramidase)